MVDAVANIALETLRDLLVEETKFLLSVKNVKIVERDLGIIHGLLMRDDRERSDSPTLKAYVSQLTDLAFEAETVLETYEVEVQSSKQGSRKSLKNKFRRYICILCECSTVQEVGKDLRDIISRLADLKTKLESEFGQQSASSSNHNDHLLRQTYDHEFEPHFVGMEKEIESIISMLTKGEEETRSHQRVIKIYGMGGLGKTTLARKIYNHKQVVEFYGIRAWVCITQQFQPTAVLANILRQVNANIAGIDSMGDSQLVVEVHEFLEERNKKCLIVMDDIWENDHWEIIKPAFPLKCGVLLTTRSESIAANQQGHIPYNLQLLTEDQGWELLHKIALPNYHAPSVETGLKSLEDIGVENIKLNSVLKEKL